MNNLHFSEAAQDDLLEIKAYIEEELQNSSAALSTVNKIIKSLRILRTYANVGTLLSSVANVESDYRFVKSGNYLSFYRVQGQDVYVDRILYARRDYMRVLFGDAPYDETEE